jgi:hypothetical protein
MIVGGDWNASGGRASGYVAKLAKSLTTLGGPVELYNGGAYESLTRLTQKEYSGLNGVVIWMPNVPNHEDKLVGEIKKNNPQIMLVSSKVNTRAAYNPHDLIARALTAKANLMIEFKNAWCVTASIIDPLGNRFLQDEENIDVMAFALWHRLTKLRSYTRIGSRQIGERPMIAVPEEFLEVVRGYADRFHELIHAANQDRLLGNASFRCERGFPSMRAGLNLIYVTQRNLDKRDLTVDGFVPVELSGRCAVNYLGGKKPSVDTPIQRELYRHYQNLRFMIHAHVYIEGAPFTSKVIPCGAMEEVQAITDVWPDPETPTLAVNLKGHGCLIATDCVASLRDIPFVGRPMYEDQFSG